MTFQPLGDFLAELEKAMEDGSPSDRCVLCGSTTALLHPVRRAWACSKCHTPPEPPPAYGLLDKQPQEKGSGWTIEAFSDAADRISYIITAKPFGWLEEEVVGAWTAHDRHLYDGSCAICKAPHAPGALRVVIDAVLDAALADPDIAAALARRVAGQETQR